MATTTTKLGLTKPDGADLVDIAVLNANSDKIDTAVGTSIVTSVTRPSVPYSGQSIYETDSKSTNIWVPATSSWQPVNTTYVCTFSTRPAVPYQGQIIYETDTLNTYIRNSSSWLRMGGVPAGTVIAWPNGSAPSGYLICDGTVYPNTTYPELSAVLGVTYGGSSGTSFGVPDLRGRAIVGVDGGTGRVSSNNALGNAAGAQSHTLTIAEMPSHNHQYVPTPQSGVAAATGSNWGITAPTSGAFTTSTGGGGAHNNMQPYMVLNYAIKV